jgi:hypothetical protein
LVTSFVFVGVVERTSRELSVDNHRLIDNHIDNNIEIDDVAFNTHNRTARRSPLIIIIIAFDVVDDVRESAEHARVAVCAAARRRHEVAAVATDRCTTREFSETERDADFFAIVDFVNITPIFVFAYALIDFPL